MDSYLLVRMTDFIIQAIFLIGTKRDQDICPINSKDRITIPTLHVVSELEFC